MTKIDIKFSELGAITNVNNLMNSYLNQEVD